MEGSLERNGDKAWMALHLEQGRTRRRLSGKPCDTLTYVSQAKILAFTRHSVALVEGGPEERRRFLDRVAAHLENQHLANLGRYRRYKQQLQQCLGNGSDLALYQSFKHGWAALSEQLVTRRQAALKSLMPFVLDYFAEWFPDVGALTFQYRTRNVSDLGQYQKRLLSLSARELLQKRMLGGAHLDELEISLGGQDARKVASAGQMRAVAMALVFGARALIHKTTGIAPILVLDDADAELDRTRWSKVMAVAEEAGQTLVSTSEYAIIRGFERGTVFKVDTGTVRLERDGG